MLFAGILLASLPAAEARAGEPKEESGEGRRRIEALFRPKGEILRFFEFCVRDDFVRLYVDKFRGTSAPASRDDANEIDFHARHSSVGLGARVEAGPLLEGRFRVGLLSANLYDTVPGDSDLLSQTAASDVHERARMDLGVEFSLGAEAHFPVITPFRLGAQYEIGFGTAKVDGETIFRTAVDGEYRYFTHVFLFFADLPLHLHEPFHGFVCPRIGIGPFLYRASSDFTAPDGSRDWDIDWIQDSGVMLTASLHMETDEGLFISIRGEFIGRTGFTAGMGMRF